MYTRREDLQIGDMEKNSGASKIESLDVALDIYNQIEPFKVSHTVDCLDK